MGSRGSMCAIEKAAYAFLIMRDRPCEEPRSFGMENCSNPST